MAILKRYMEQLIREMELNDTLESKTSPGSYDFPLDENTDIIISENEKGISLHCVVCPVPTKNEEDFFTHALHGNLLGQGTMGATLGLDFSGKQLTLSQEMDYNIEYERFKGQLEDFLNTAEGWREESATFENS